MPSLLFSVDHVGGGCMADLDEVEERHWWLALSKVPGVGPFTFIKLVQSMGSPKAVFQASSEALARIERVGPRLAGAILSFRGHEQVSRELDRMDRMGVRMLLWGTQQYPPSLAAIPDPPPILFVRGEILEQDRAAVALVGSRAASQQGLRVTQRIARELARAGVTVVSGLARGIDSEAHKGALAEGGRTIAVLGCGLNVIYPPENRDLFFRILEHGAVVSEYSLDEGPHAVHFPSRNRIISGLCLGVTIVEAAPQSGSLITARLALEQGREVFAVPGHVDSMRSRGTNRLIKEGARLVESAADILEELAPLLEACGRPKAVPQETTDVKEEPLSLEETKLLSMMGDQEMHIDELIQASGMGSSVVTACLLQLELKGRIRQLPGKRFERCS